VNYTADDYHRAKPPRAPIVVEDRSAGLSIVLVIVCAVCVALRLLGVA
jgi:hypothetical protein